MAYFLIFFGVVLRIGSHFHDHAFLAPLFQYLPNIPNFSPIAALALLGGVYLSKRFSIMIPLAAMLISDYFIGYYNIYIMISVYGSFILIGLIGAWLRKHKTLANVIGASLTGSILFFLATNFAVWAVPQSMYPHTAQGLLDSYTMGLPFFRNTIAGDLFYVGAFFGLMETTIFIVKKFLPSQKTQIS
jgi:ABC-type proline/glycine betaine transport system permease subunit